VTGSWRVLDFLRAGITFLTGHVDPNRPEAAVNWRIIEYAASKRVDHHFNWRHGSTYLIGGQFREVMYAMARFGSELISLVSQLIEMCPQECRSATDKLLAHYSELSECLSAKYKPISAAYPSGGA
jgi:hypothetical protein